MNEQKFNRRFRVSCIVAVAFLAGLLLTGAMFWFLKSGSGTIKTGWHFDPFSGMLLLSGVMICGLIPVVRRKILNRRARRSSSEEGLLNALNASVILSLALLEAACYFYLIYFFIRGEMLYLYAALGLGAIGFGLYFPRQERWKRYLDAHPVKEEPVLNTEVDYGQR